eukprot:1674355-Pleurochrysis_carterae.AAC.1
MYNVIVTAVFRTADLLLARPNEEELRRRRDDAGACDVNRFVVRCARPLDAEAGPGHLIKPSPRDTSLGSRVARQQSASAMTSVAFLSCYAAAAPVLRRRAVILATNSRASCATSRPPRPNRKVMKAEAATKLSSHLRHEIGTSLTNDAAGTPNIIRPARPLPEGWPPHCEKYALATQKPQIVSPGSDSPNSKQYTPTSVTSVFQRLEAEPEASPTCRAMPGLVFPPRRTASTPLPEGWPPTKQSDELDIRFQKKPLRTSESSPILRISYAAFASPETLPPMPPNIDCESSIGQASPRESLTSVRKSLSSPVGTRETACTTPVAESRPAAVSTAPPRSSSRPTAMEIHYESERRTSDTRGEPSLAHSSRRKSPAAILGALNGILYSGKDSDLGKSCRKALGQSRSQRELTPSTSSRHLSFARRASLTTPQKPQLVNRV